MNMNRFFIFFTLLIMTGCATAPQNDWLIEYGTLETGTPQPIEHGAWDDDASVAEQPLCELPTTRYFADLGLLCMRSSWEPDAKVFSMKCSAPGGTKQWKTGWDLYHNEKIDCLNLMHHHPDNLSYIFASGDDFFTCEDGYNRNVMPDNHNVLLVDGHYTDVHNINDVYVESAKARLAQNPAYDVVADYTAAVTHFTEENGVITYTGETQKIYPDALQMREVSRSFFTDNLEVMFFVDRLVSDVPHKYSTIQNTCAVGERVADNAFAYTVNGEAWHYTVHADTAVAPRQYDQTIIGVMTTQEPDKVCRADIKTLRFDTVLPSETAVFFECLAPAAATVTYAPYKMTVALGGKTYTCIAKEGFHLYDIHSDKNISVTVEDGAQTAVYQW